MTSSSIWQADLSRRPQPASDGKPLWELLICPAGEPETGPGGQPDWQFARRAAQAQVNGDWVRQQLAAAIAQRGRPRHLQVFRPQSFSLIAAAAEPLGLTVEATRHTPQLKALLQHLAEGELDWHPLEIELLPPQPLPERLRGERWQFAALAAGEVDYAFRDRPIPILSTPDYALPLRQGLSSDLAIPGLVIYGGRSAMLLARWLQSVRPMSLSPMAGAPDGVILQAGLAERWVLATYEDPEVAQAAAVFRQRQQAASGIHFLSIQPDDSGVTTSGFWLLRAP